MDHNNRVFQRLRLPVIIILVICAIVLLLVLIPRERGFRYQHDPRDNPRAMEDIVVNQKAVYGFSPSPDGSLSSYVKYEWTDPAAVESYKQMRLDYFASYQQLYDVLDEMTAAGENEEAIARAVSAKRNEIRIASYEGNPEGLASLYERNLKTYGHEEGPTPDELYEQYASWQTVIEKAFSHNCGMDACVGLYDDYYEYYIAFGYVDG